MTPCDQTASWHMNICFLPDHTGFLFFNQLEKSFHFMKLEYIWASLVAQLVKNLPAMWETWVWSMDWADPLEKGKATHSSVLAWRIPGTEEPGKRPSMGSHRVGHDWNDLVAAAAEKHNTFSIARTTAFSRTPVARGNRMQPEEALPPWRCFP